MPGPTQQVVAGGGGRPLGGGSYTLPKLPPLLRPLRAWLLGRGTATAESEVSILGANGAKGFVPSAPMLERLSGAGRAGAKSGARCEVKWGAWEGGGGREEVWEKGEGRG